jgi:secondary thiamine-phosphate synthase enzyme
MLAQYKFDITTPGRGIINITDNVAELVIKATVTTGLCHIFLHHTSASLIICENHDPLVQRDLEAFMCRLIPDGDPLCEHTAEGPDDMPSHVRTILTSSFLSIPITDKRLALGTWQGIYLWEHRLRSHHRKLTVTVQGE